MLFDFPLSSNTLVVMVAEQSDASTKLCTVPLENEVVCRSVPSESLDQVVVLVRPSFSIWLSTPEPKFASYIVIVVVLNVSSPTLNVNTPLSNDGFLIINILFSETTT